MRLVRCSCVELTLTNRFLGIQCLERDGYRCVISNKLDPRAAAGSGPHLKLETGKVEITQAAHIIPYALNNFEMADADDKVGTAFDNVSVAHTELGPGSLGKDVANMDGTAGIRRSRAEAADRRRHQSSAKHNDPHRNVSSPLSQVSFEPR